MPPAAEAAHKAPSTTPTASLFDVLGEKTMPLAELRRLATDATIGRAWSAMDIEFGHRKYCVTGPIGKDTSTCIVEDGVEWSGPKGKMHKHFSEILEEKPPEVGRYRMYVNEVRVSRDKDLWERLTDAEAARTSGLETRSVTTDIDTAEGEAAIALLVRLTDQGRSKTTG